MAAPSSRIRLIRTLTASLCALALAPAAAQAAVLHVDASSAAPDAACGTEVAPCATIAAAAALVTGGDELRIAPGDYQGATFSSTVHLIGPAAGGARIHSRIASSATLEVRNLEFSGFGAGPAIAFSGDATADVLVTDSTFTGISGLGAISLDAVHAATVSNSTFTNTAGSAILARGARGLIATGNTVTGGSGFVDIADSDGTVDRIRIYGNVVTGLSGHAIAVGAGVRGVTIDRNRISQVGLAAIDLHGRAGDSTADDITIRGNDLSDARYGVRADSVTLEGAIAIHSNRIVAMRTAAILRSDLTPATLDARGNWWGRSAGPVAGSVVGSGIDTSTPLRLVGVDAPAAIMVGASGEVGIRLVGAVGAEPDADIAGFPVTFTSALADVAPRATVTAGRARAVITAGSTTGESETVATLDDETVRATTLILPLGAIIPPGNAQPTVAATPAPRFTALIQLVRIWAARTVTRGVTQVVTTNQPASLRSTVSIDHYTAKVLGLRRWSSQNHNPILIGRAVTRAATGRRVITIQIDARTRAAIKRYGHPVAIYVVTRVSNASGASELAYRRLVIPAKRR